MDEAIAIPFFEPDEDATPIAADDFRQDGPWRRIYDLSHARCEPAHCLAPGLFRAIKRGERKKAKLDVIYEYGDNRRVEFRGPEPLGADDLRVLQGLVALAGPYGQPLDASPSNAQSQALRRSLKPKWDAVSEPAIMVTTTYHQLANELGLSRGGQQYKDIQNCIERLWMVSIIAERNGKRRGFQLLSHYESDTNDGSLVFALNPMIAQAVAGGGQHTRIPMDEVRAIDTEACRLLHSRLCAWINPGDCGTINLDTLCSYLWPNEASSAASRRKRRQRTRQTVHDLSRKVGWRVTEKPSSTYEIQRPA